MDTLIFGLLLAVALIIVFRPERWLVITSWAVGFVAVGLLFAHHVTSTLNLEF